MNDIMKSALTSAKVPSRLEPSGLHRADEKLPDEIMVVPWRNEKLLIWDVTCQDTRYPLLLSSCHQGDRVRSSSSAGRGEEGGQICQPHPRASLLPNCSGDNGCSWPTHQGAPRSLGAPDIKGGGSYNLPRPDAVSGSAAWQLCLCDGHYRSTRFWPFLLTNFPTQNVQLFSILDFKISTHLTLLPISKPSNIATSTFTNLFSSTLITCTQLCLPNACSTNWIRVYICRCSDWQATINDAACNWHSHHLIICA